MARNPYFTEGFKSEQFLYQDLIIEAVKIYGHECFYLPRSIISRDELLGEPDASKFEKAYQLEMYIADTDGFQGDGVLMSKFGLELRDQATFIVAKRRWEYEVGANGGGLRTSQPTEGDLIYIPLTKSMFEVKFVDSKQPFYQLADLPIFRLECELFEYSNEQIDTTVEQIDAIELEYADVVELTLSLDTAGNTFNIGESVRQDIGGIYVQGEVAAIDDDMISVANVNTSDGSSATFEVTDTSYGQLEGLTSGSLNDITAVSDTIDDPGGQNSYFKSEGDSIIDFSEQNPWGEP